MQRWITTTLAGVILMSSAGITQAASVRLMERSMESGICPKDDAAVVIVSKDPYCGAHHLSGDPCDARWKAYWFETAQYNNFLSYCRMQHWPEHKS
jgi:hypothetical protein